MPECSCCKKWVIRYSPLHDGYVCENCGEVFKEDLSDYHYDPDEDTTTLADYLPR